MQDLQLRVVAVFRVYALLFSSLWPVKSLVSVLSVDLDWFISASCASLLFSMRLNIGAQSSLIPVFCQFEFTVFFILSYNMFLNFVF